MGKSSKVPSFASRSKEVVNSNGQSISIRSFMEQENISQDVSLDTFIDNETRGEFDSLYEGVNAIKNSTSKKIPELNDNIEKVDLESKGWDDLKKVNTDDDRKMLAQAQFQNPLCSDPATNLTFQGFRRLDQSKVLPILGSDSFSISNGQLVPLSGFKRKGEKLNRRAKEVEVKKIRLSDFGSVMKSVFFSKFNKKVGLRKASATDLEDFKTYLGHYKAGQEETANFLSYYNCREELDLEQTKEVTDFENQFSTFSNYYGEAEDLFCRECEKKHKFCQ